MNREMIIEVMARAIHLKRQSYGFGGQAAWEYEPPNIHDLHLNTARAVFAALEANGVRLVDDNRYYEVLRDVEEALEDNIERYASKTFTGKIVAPQYPWIARMMRALHRLRSL